MNGFIESFANENEIDIVKWVDITSLSVDENRDYPYAILLVKALPKAYIAELNRTNNTDYSVFVNQEKSTDELADRLSVEIQKLGYNAISQSENQLEARNEYDADSKSTVLPHKKIAVMSGIGWIGKNNLLITKNYGAAITMCTVLTDMPLKNKTSESSIDDGCGNCDLCVRICPEKALIGKEWKFGINRDNIINVHLCSACLKCLAGCRYSIKYSNN